MLTLALASLALPFGAAASFAAYPGPGGRLTSPANGTVVSPGQAFPFSYDTHVGSDICPSVAVYVQTTKPGAQLSEDAGSAEVCH
jgi:hypothetical protein